MTGWIVTGTDTGVGKTVVAAAICACLRAAGTPVVYVKPVQSGAADGDDDAADVAALAGVATVTGPLIGPSLAPGVAVRLAGARLSEDELLAVVHEAVVAEHPGHVPVVEGAGGVLVELGSDGTTIADLAARCRLPLVVAARPGLGTLNHTALTLEAIERRGLELAGVVVCGYPPEPDDAARTNLAELHRLSGSRLVGVVPHLDLATRKPLAPASGWLAAAVGGDWQADRDPRLASPASPTPRWS